MRKNFILIVLIGLMHVPLAAQFRPIVSPLKTPWTDQVDKNNPLPEYPRPQMVRSEWMNLNGYWQFKSGKENDVLPQNQDLGEQIVVPFSPEATLSGVVRHYERVWYRKLVTIPSDWSGQRILIHFGAIDWESEVYINGVSKGIHKGGYDEITYDITDQLVGTGPQEIIVRVYDPTRDYGQPRGKQTTAPGGIMYTCTTGIWQTVWLEPVATQNIQQLRITPDIDNNLLKLTVNTANATGLTVVAKAKDGSKIVGTISGNANTELTIPVPNAKLWSPESPFLYDLDVQLMDGNQLVDAVSSYFGMRKITLVRDKSTPSLYLNNKPIYMIGPLDQGYWPDGIYTAPTDEALRFDIEAAKTLGFNMVRKHIKVEPQRWYYWADKLGILVWQDMPSANSYDTPTGVPVDKNQFNLELTRMINNLYNSPSIVMWVIFNEWQGEFDSPGRTLLVKSLDPTRLINQGSGHERSDEACDIIDGHYYSPPKCPSSTRSAVVCGEYGGLGLAIKGHLWSRADNPYGDSGTAENLISQYSDYTDRLLSFKKNQNMSAAVYTQITDVESEINGFLTYDRLYKFDPAIIKKLNEKLIYENIVSHVDLIPTSQKAPQTWKYSTTLVSGWEKSDFNDAAWSSSVGGFGTLKDKDNKQIGTLWNTSNIWIRKSFEVGDLSPLELKNLRMSVFHDEDVKIYINGVLAASLSGYTHDYKPVEISRAAKDALIKNGTNTMAIHCHQTIGGQYIDAGLSYTILSGEDQQTNGAVVAFNDYDYSGTAQRIDVGEYTAEKLQLLGISDKSIASLKVAEGYKLILFEGKELTGNSITISSTSSNLIDVNWDKKASSLKVITNGVTGLGGIYTLQNRNSNLLMEVQRAADGNGVNIIQNSPSEKTNQQFLFTELANGAYRITAIHSLKQIAVDDENLADSANVQQWSNTGAPNQQFIPVATGDGYYKLIAMHSARAIEVALASTNTSANIKVGTNENLPNQMWRLSPVTLNETGDGLFGNFYNGKNFEKQVYQQITTNFNIDWGMKSPDPSVNVDLFSARWTGLIVPKYSEKYTFAITSDNGRRLWINDQLIIDKWIGDWDTEYSGAIDLIADQKYTIKIEYFEEVGGANFRLRWSSASQRKEIIPQSQLYSNTLPSIKLSTPDNKTLFANTDIITLSATATNPTGSVLHVNFYDGDNLLSSVANPPYSYNWQHMTTGEHTLKAEVVCDNDIILPSAPIMVDITTPNSLLDHGFNSEITVYPNPVKETIILHAANPLVEVNYKIYNISGQQMVSAKLTGNEINVEHFPKGMYTLQISNNKALISKKIIIQ